MCLYAALLTYGGYMFPSWVPSQTSGWKQEVATCNTHTLVLYLWVSGRRGRRNSRQRPRPPRSPALTARRRATARDLSGWWTASLRLPPPTRLSSPGSQGDTRSPLGPSPRTNMSDRNFVPSRPCPSRSSASCCAWNGELSLTYHGTTCVFTHSCVSPGPTGVQSGPTRNCCRRDSFASHFRTQDCPTGSSVGVVFFF